MVDELKNIIEEYLNWLYPNPVEILSDGFTTVIYCRDILDHTINHNSNRAYKTYYLCQKFRNFIPEIKRLGLPRFSTEIPWRSEKDMTMIKNLAKDLEKEWKVDLLLILPHVT